MSGRRAAIGGLGLVVLVAGGAVAAPPEDHLLPPALHASPKGQALATKHARALHDLNAEIYHCMPWVEVARHSIGFFRPKNAEQDDRYLSIRIYVEQEPSIEFARLTTGQRASAMFSRYVGPLLKRMTRYQSIVSDDAIDGFTIILEWLKQKPESREARPVHETIAVFITKRDAQDYLLGQTSVPDLAARARILGWDGETALGALRFAAWDDDFVSSFRVKNYEPEPGVTCR